MNKAMMALLASLAFTNLASANLEVFLSPSEQTETLKKDLFYNYISSQWKLPSLNSALGAAQYEKALALVLAGYNDFSQSTDEKKTVVAYLLFKNKMPLTALEQLTEVAQPTSIPAPLQESLTEILGTQSDVVVANIQQFSDSWFTAWFKKSKQDYTAQAGTKGQNFRFVQTWKEISLALNRDDLNQATKKLNEALNDASFNSTQKDLIRLTIARLLYGANYLEPSLKFYDTISKQSPFFNISKEERAWILLRKGQYSDVMSQISGVLMTDLAPQMTPEAFELEALTELRLCRYQDTVKTVNRFKTVYKARKKRLEEGKSSASLASQGVHSKSLLPRDSFMDPRLEEFKALDSALKKEGVALADLKPRISNLAPEFADTGTQITNIINKNSGAQSRINTAFIGRVTELIDDELRDIEAVVSKIQIVEAELLNRSLAVASNKSPTKNETTKVSNLTPTDKSKIVFDHEKQIWIDEVFDVQFEVSGTCVR